VRAPNNWTSHAIRRTRTLGSEMFPRLTRQKASERPDVEQMGAEIDYGAEDEGGARQIAVFYVLFFCLGLGTYIEISSCTFDERVDIPGASAECAGRNGLRLELRFSGKEASVIGVACCFVIRKAA